MPMMMSCRTTETLQKILNLNKYDSVKSDFLSLEREDEESRKRVKEKRITKWARSESRIWMASENGCIHSWFQVRDQGGKDGEMDMSRRGRRSNTAACTVVSELTNSPASCL